MERQSSFFDTQPIFILDHETLEILDVNEAAVEMYGYSREDFLSMSVNDFGQKKKRVDLIEESMNENGSADKIWIQQTKNGDTLYVQFTHHTFYFEGKPAKLAIAHNVSEQVNKRETHRLKFPKYVTHKSNYPLAEIEWNKNLEIRSWSERAEELFGWREDEVVGQERFYEELIASEELEEAQKKINKAIENKQNHYSVEGKINTKSGKTLICKWYNSLIYDQNNELLSIHSLVTDISRRKQSENLFRALSEESLVGVYLLQDDTFRYVNPRFAEIVGYDRKEVLDEISPLDLVHPQDREYVRKNIDQRINGSEESKEYDFRCITKEGDIKHVSAFGSTINYMGEPAIIGTLLDITTNKETIRKYWASVESFQDLFDSISDAIYIQDEEGRFLEVNKGAVNLYGYEQSFYIGKNPDVLFAPGKVDMVKLQERFKRALNGDPQSFECWGRRKNGEVFPKEMVVNPGTYFGEDVVITIARDISERYKAEEELRKSEELFRQLFQNAPIPITLMDKRQDIRRVNSAFEEAFGYSQEEIKGLNIDKLVVPETEKDLARELSSTVFDGETVHNSGRRLRSDGSLIDVLIYGLPVVVDEKTVGIYGIYVDITDRKQAEEKVKNSLKEKEVLLAEIHHRVKNNLAVITGLLELQSYNTKSEKAKDVLKTSQMRVNSIALIHEKLYQNKNLSEISFDVYIDQLIQVITTSLASSQTEVSVDIKADPIKLTITQAIPCALMLNELITNAYKHAFVDREEGEIKIVLESKNDEISMEVRDNGKGIPDDINFENPTSLGIELIRTLTKQLEGEAEFSDAKPGTKFLLSFTREL